VVISNFPYSFSHLPAYHPFEPKKFLVTYTHKKKCKNFIFLQTHDTDAHLYEFIHKHLREIDPTGPKIDKVTTGASLSRESSPHIERKCHHPPNYWLWKIKRKIHVLVYVWERAKQSEKFDNMEQKNGLFFKAKTKHAYA
jgi:hypothetical protein